MTTADLGIVLTSAARSHVGASRTLNEDAVLDRPDLGLWAVADGMGGHESGDFAAAAIVDALAAIPPAESGAVLLAEVRARLHDVHQDLRHEAAQRGGGHLIGSTIVALVVVGRHYACLWAGDSRLYRLRDGRLRAMTRDHSHVQELLDLGQISAEEAARHPQASVITRAVGAADELEIDTLRDRFEPGDTLLLCSDGLVRAVPEDRIADIIGRNPVDKAVDALIDSALQAGAQDNVSVVVVGCNGAGDTAAEEAHDGDSTLPPAGGLVADPTLFAWRDSAGSADQTRLSTAAPDSGAGDPFIDDPFEDDSPSGARPPGRRTDLPPVSRPADPTAVDPLTASPPASKPGPAGPDTPTDRNAAGRSPDETVIAIRPTGPSNPGSDIGEADEETTAPFLHKALSVQAAEPAAETGQAAPEPSGAADARQAPAPAHGGIGDRLGRYRLLERIGEGAMAEVYRAYDPDIGRTLAIKLLRAEVCHDSEYVGRFLREARAVGALAQPNIVSVYDVGQVGNRPYIVMELIEGQPLEDRLETEVMPTVEDVIAIGIQFGEALDYAHSRGVIHRDLKPSNVIVSSDGKTITITDFGIARIEDGDVSARTQVGFILGTPSYMSPEQARGEPVDGRSDLFSVGVILYQMLSGRKPFAAGDMATLLKKLTGEEPERLDRLAPYLPAGLVRIVERLLEKEPDRRFATGGELARALLHERDALAEQTNRPGRRRLLSAWTATTVVLTLIVGLALVASSVFVHDRVRTELLADHVGLGITLTEALAGDMATRLGAGQETAIESEVVETAGRWGLAELVVTDAAGIAIAASDDLMIGLRYVEPSGMTPIGHASDVDIWRVDRPGRPLALHFRTVIGPPDDGVGAVHVTRTAQNAQRAWNVLAALLTGIVAIGTLAVPVLSLLLRRLMIRPLHRLERALNEVSEGNTAVHLSHRRGDLVGKVFDAFNRMTDAVRRRSV